MKNNILMLAVVGLIIWSHGAQAQTVYHVERDVGSGTVSGFIETDGMTGSLSMGNIVSWSFDLFDGTDTMSISSASPYSGLQGTAWSYLSATSTELSFDFDGALLDTDVEGITFHGQDDPLTQTYSVDYNLLGNDLGKLEQLVHQFGAGEEHRTEQDRMGVVVIGTVDGTAPVSYDYQQIDYPGAPDTRVFGINDGGDVVGNGTIVPDRFPFVYASRKGTFTNVAPLDGYSRTVVLGINDPGVMVGSVTNLDETTRSGFIRDEEGNFTVFSHLDAVSSTIPRGVNNKGLVTGFRDDLNATTVGFIYDPKSGTFTNLNPTSFLTFAQGINSKGEVVGSSNFTVANDPCAGLGNPFRRYGWLRATDGTVTYFEVNGSHTSARGINDEGSIVGFFRDLDDGKFKGFKVELDGSPCQSLTIAAGDVLEFPGAEATFLGGITNAGDIVGSYEDASNTHGFIATPQ